MKVRAHVYVQSEDLAKSAWLQPGDTVPEWATVTNPDALVDEPAAEPDVEEDSASRKRPARKPAAE